MTGQAPRVLPRLDPDNELFWTSGARGALELLRCGACGHWLHPVGPVCPRCLSGDLAPQPVSGRAVVASCTVNHQRWIPGLDVPYAIAVIELAEQPALRLVTNVVGCAPEDVRIGMPVRLVFEQAEDVYLPLAAPAAEPAEEPPAVPAPAPAPAAGEQAAIRDIPQEHA